jgi:hypothetical protein
MTIKAMGPSALEADPALDAFQRSLVSLTEAVNRRLDAEANPAVRRSRAASQARLPSAATVRRRFRSHEELAVYVEYVTRRFHRSVDPSALDLTDASGRLVERPDRAAVQKAFEDLGAAPAADAKVSLRTANDLVVVADRSGALRRIDLDTGAEQGVPGAAAPLAAGRMTPDRGAELADLALSALGRPDLR